MANFTDGELEVLAEQERDARADGEADAPELSEEEEAAILDSIFGQLG